MEWSFCNCISHIQGFTLLVAVRHVVCNNRATYVPMRFPSDPSKRRRLTHVILMNFFCVLFLQYKCHPLSWRFVVCFACEGESERGGRCDSCTCGHPSGTEREGESERGVQGGDAIDVRAVTRAAHFYGSTSGFLLCLCRVPLGILSCCFCAVWLHDWLHVEISLRGLRGQPLQLPVKVKLERTFLALHLGALPVRVGLCRVTSHLSVPGSFCLRARTTPNGNGEGAR